jgi:hypothetical protein
MAEASAAALIQATASRNNNNGIARCAQLTALCQDTHQHHRRCPAGLGGTADVQTEHMPTGLSAVPAQSAPTQPDAKVAIHHRGSTADAAG